MADDSGRFAAFVTEVEPRLRRALIATYGAQIGREATVDALAYAWEQRDRLAEMINPVGYLYRVGQTSARRQRRVAPAVSPSLSDADDPPEFEPALWPALASLSEQQRAVVVLIHGYGWSQREAAATLGLSPSTVRNHLDRAMTRLRKATAAPGVLPHFAGDEDAFCRQLALDTWDGTTPIVVAKPIGGSPPTLGCEVIFGTGPERAADQYTIAMLVPLPRLTAWALGPSGDADEQSQTLASGSVLHVDPTGPDNLGEPAMTRAVIDRVDGTRYVVTAYERDASFVANEAAVIDAAADAFPRT